MRFAVYSRKSVYTGKGESIENQVVCCKQYILSHFTDAAESDISVYEDEGFSGKTADRPRFKQMLKDIRQGLADVLVCYRLDRISRSVGDFAALIDELNSRGVPFICVSEEFDTSKPMGKAMMYIASVFAQLERETIAERVRDNMLMLARTGRWLGGATPTGFVSERVSEVIIDGKVRSACRLKPVASEMHAVREIFGGFLAQGSVSGVSRLLLQKGIVSRTGKPFSLPGIREILQNPVYCAADSAAYEYFSAARADICFDKADCTGERGLLSYGKRDYRKKHAPRQPVDRWIIAIGRHKGAIEGEKWVCAQRVLDNASRPRGECMQSGSGALLSGLLVCSECGGKMHAKTRASRLFDYICDSKRHGGAALCRCPNLAGQQADHAVFAALERILQVCSGPAIAQGLRELGAGEKRALIALAVRRLEWDGAAIHIYIEDT